MLGFSLLSPLAEAQAAAAFWCFLDMESRKFVSFATVDNNIYDFFDH